MTLRVEFPDQAGWSTVSTAGLHVVVRAGGGLLDRVRTAAADGDLDEVLDALAGDGVRATPDFVAVADVEPARVVARGSAYAVVTGPEGPVELRAAGRGPWADTDAPAGATAIVLRTGQEAGEPPGPPGPAGQGSTSPSVPGTEQAPAPSGPASEATELPPADAEPAPGAWRRPDLLTRRGAVAPESQPPAEPPQPVRPAEPQPAAAPAEVPQPPATSRVDEPEQVDELPSYDHLFGATQHDRPAYIEQHDTGTISEPPIGHAPIESAGGYAPDNPAPGPEHTLAPPAHTMQPPPHSPPPPEQAPIAPPARGGIIDSVPWRSGGSNVAAPEPAARAEPAPPTPRPAGTHTPPPAPSLRPAVVPPAPPVAPPSPAPQPPVAHPPAPQAPPRAQPPAPPATPAPDLGAADDAEATVDRSALLGAGAAESGPTVLAVLCPAGHTSPPHSGACRQCGREIPPQQPFQTARPPLGVLRLPTGDVVTLDRGVLLGRSPKVNAELDAAARPHLVRVTSPQNDISRNHVEIVLEGWHVLIRDLGSTNGTTVTLPGQQPVRLRPSDQQVLEPGTVITLADEVAITYEVPS